MICSLLACTIGCQFSGNIPVKTTGDARVSNYAVDFLKTTGYPGVWIAVAMNGKIIATCAAGYKDVGARHPATLADRIRYGSISKPVVGTLAGHFVQKGQLSFSANLFETLPGIASVSDQGYAAVNLEMLLSHSAGFTRDGTQPKTSEKTNQADFQNLRWLSIKDELKKKPLFAPGSGYEYSGVGITLAALMLEKVAGKAYEKILTDIAVQRWGLKSMGVGDPAPELNTRPYLLKDGQFVPRPAGIDWRYAYGPAGNIHSTIEDMCRFGLLHCSNKEFTPTMLVQMHTIMNSVGSTRISFPRQKEGRSSYLLHHSGAMSNRYRGDYASLWVEPSAGIVVCAYVNVGPREDKNEPMQNKLMKPLFDALKNSK